MLRSVALIGTFADGHHLTYAGILIRQLQERGITVYLIGGSELVEGLSLQNRLQASAVIPISNNAGEIEKLRFIRLALRQVEAWKVDVTHLLQLDRFALSLFLARPFCSLRNVRATLHWGSFIPEIAPEYAAQRKMKITSWLVRQMFRSGLRVMVHSRLLAQALDKRTGCGTADYVPYPVESYAVSDEERLNRRNKLRECLNIPLNATLLLCFGGTRFDKGADIAIASLPFMAQEIYLLIAGRAEDFSEAVLRSKSEALGVSHRVRLHLQFIPDEQLLDYFVASNIVLIPYRKSFPGQSGPLTIAAALGIPVASADCAILHETVEQYSLGKTYPAEQAIALAQTVMAISDSHIPQEKTARFISEHSNSAFGGAVIHSYENALTTN